MKYNLTRHKLKVIDTYCIYCYGKIRKAQLVHSTARGFNFVDFFDNKFLFKKHIYPQEVERYMAKELTFYLPNKIVINKISNSDIDIKLFNEFISEFHNKSRIDILYDWVKTNAINVSEFKQLLRFI